MDLLQVACSRCTHHASCSIACLFSLPYSLSGHELAEFRNACIAARGNGAPLLQYLSIQSTSSYFSHSSSSLDEVMRTLIAFPALENFEMSVTLPRDEAALATSFANVQGPFHKGKQASLPSSIAFKNLC